MGRLATAFAAKARAIVSGKLANSLELLREFAHNHPDADLAPEIHQAAAARDQAPQSPDLASLLGLEGSGSRAYFQGFAKMVRHSFNFTGRQRHPAPDPVNALLSLGYTLVYNELSSLLDGMGFDPYLGFFHQPRHGHATLASDLLEEFRAPLVDRLTLHLINNRILQEPDFYPHTSGGLYLLDQPRKRYFQEYEHFVTRPQAAAADDAEMDFRRLFRRQAERLRHAVLTEENYQPFIFSWK
jgi:CRISPR-associated protein Cas1